MGQARGRHLRGDLRGDCSITKEVCVGKVYCEQVCVGRFQLEHVLPSVAMAKCVGIETGYITMGGDCVGIAWGRKIIYTLCGAGVGAPHTRFCQVQSSPHNLHASFSQCGLRGANLRV